MASAEWSRPGPRSRRPRVGMVVLALALLGTAAVGLAGVTTASAQDAPHPVDPTVVREDVRDVMSGSDYDYSPSTIERARDWIADQLSKLFPEIDGPNAGGTFGGGIGALIGWLVIVAAVVAIIVVVAWVLLNRTRRVKAESEPATEAEVEHRRRAKEWMADAERLEAAGEWKEALRARFRHLVRTLVDRRQLPDVPGRTTGELRGDLARTTPAGADPFDTCCILLELAWYAGLPTGPEENVRLRAEAQRVLDAEVSERFDAVLLSDDGGSDGRGASPPGEAVEIPVPVGSGS